jgi:hypothetical protein
MSEGLHQEKNEFLIRTLLTSGIRDNDKNRFVPIVMKGTPVKDTKLDKLTQNGIAKQFRCDDYDHVLTESTLHAICAS